MRPLRYLILISVVTIAAACSGAGQPESVSSDAASVPPNPSPSDSAARDKESWRKERYVSVNDAVRLLEAHIDEPVVLPRDLLAGIRNYRGWLADPRSVDWERRRGEVVGSLVLRKGKRILAIDYGYSTPDGCGGRDLAIPTEVRGAPALLWTVPDNTWSHIIWPVAPRGFTGRYGLSGTFEAGVMLRLARSMETQMGHAAEEKAGC